MANTTIVALTPAERDYLIYEARNQGNRCASVLTPEYQRQYPIAARPENVADREAELAFIDNLLKKLGYTPSSDHIPSQKLKYWEN